MASQVAMDTLGNLSAVSSYTGAAVTSTTCLLHDAASRLVAVGRAWVLLTTPGGTACQREADVSSFSFRFEYDAWNRRASRWGAGSGSREYIHDPAGHLLAEMKSRSTTLVTYEPSRDYVWLDGRPLAQLEYPGPVGRAEGYTYYIHLDHLGQPRALSNESKVTVWSATPTRPYGDVAEVTTVDPLTGRVVSTDLRLPGQYDERIFAAAGLSGLQGPYQNWHRWYLPTMGRYMELDPIALAGGFNAPFAPSWYAYAEGSPLRWIDPLGLGPGDWWDPEFYMWFWWNSLGATGDFWKNYRDMRKANSIGADKYFHCKANCMATRRSFGGLQTARFISESREWLDENVKRDSRRVCDEDRAANRRGQEHSRDFEADWPDRDWGCRLTCRPLAPNYLPWDW